MNLFLDQKSQKFNDKIKLFFNNILLENKNCQVALEYLKNRGIEEEEIKNFEIGWCPLKLFSKLPQEKKFLAGGLIFPIVSEYEETVAFARRSLLPENEKNSKIPKWINDPYAKTQYLYGFNRAIPYIVKNDCVVIVEGQCDVITCHKWGLKNTVGTMGPSLTKEHIVKLSRLTSNFILMFDGDSSGISSSIRSQKTIESLGSGKLKYINVNLLVNGKDYDPDLFIREFGIEKLIKHIKKLKIKNDKT